MGIKVCLFCIILKEIVRIVKEMYFKEIKAGKNYSYTNTVTTTLPFYFTSIFRKNISIVIAFFKKVLSLTQ